MMDLPVTSIFLEAHFFGDDREEMRLPCQTVSVQPGAIIVRGIEACQLQALRWTADALSFDTGRTHRRYQVGRPTSMDALTARFPLL
jgi:hypothetical protein